MIYLQRLIIIFVLDTKLFERLQKYSIVAQFAFEPINYLAQKVAFISGNIRNPHFTYLTPIESNYFSTSRFQLGTLAEEVTLDKSYSSALRDLYLKRIENDLVRVDIYDANRNADSNQFWHSAQKLHGSVFAPWWAEIGSGLDASVQTKLESGKWQSLASKHELVVDKKLKSNVAQHLLALYPYLAEVASWTQESVDAPLIEKACEEFLLSLHITDWKVKVIESHAKGMSVNSKNKVITIPSTRKMPVNKLQQLLAHEIGTHVMRSINGTNSPLILLSAGLAHYLPGEEGLATMCAQSLSKYKWKAFAGQDKYFAIGLTVGVDGKERDFRDVFEIMKLYYASESKKFDQHSLKIQEKAWSVCVRIFRGTTGLVKGQCYTKDLAYYKGNRLMWEFYIKDPAFFPQLFKGKFSPFEPGQVESLKALGILN